jgi:hypothetical protein
MEVNKGCIKYHSGPKTVCLYTVTTSLFTHQQITVLPDFLRFSEKKLFWCYLKQPLGGIFLGGSCIGYTANLYLQLLIRLSWTIRQI